MGVRFSSLGSTFERRTDDEAQRVHRARREAAPSGTGHRDAPAGLRGGDRRVPPGRSGRGQGRGHRGGGRGELGDVLRVLPHQGRRVLGERGTTQPGVRKGSVRRSRLRSGGLRGRPRRLRGCQPGDPSRPRGRRVRRSAPPARSGQGLRQRRRGVDDRRDGVTARRRPAAPRDQGRLPGQVPRHRDRVVGSHQCCPRRDRTR